MLKPQKTPQAVLEEPQERSQATREELRKFHQTNFDRIGHEFTLLHARANHFISMNWMIVAAYVSVLGVALAHPKDIVPLYVSLFLAVMSVLGFVTAFVGRHGFSEAVTAISMYLDNQRTLEKDLPDDDYVRHTGLRRSSVTTTVEQTTNGKSTATSSTSSAAHEKSLALHERMPAFFMLFWGFLFVVSVAFPLYVQQLPSPTGKPAAQPAAGA
jgi:hypothetical protein